MQTGLLLLGRRLRFPLMGVLLVWGGSISSAEESSWKVNGMLQTHPLESWHTLGSAGTQVYFAPADVASAEEEQPTTTGEAGWLSGGEMQWHPLQSWHALGRTGTQIYLGEVDPEPEKWEGVAESTWKVDGMWQWHPQESWYALGSSGTQFYFATADIAPPPEVVPESPPPSPGSVVMADSDGDGVPDERDRCSGTSPGTVVDASGCSPDPDGDGVRREDDRCPNTPAGVAVNKQGCWVLGTVLFRYDDAHIQKKFKLELKKVFDALEKYPDIRVEVQGHTDSVGTPEYNDRLSLRRSTSVKESLQRLGISSERLSPAGYGENQPLNNNTTEAERAVNRRVDIVTVE
ncbi:MAG: OmpA family protein [Magnetococcales bacterium]|nr:OmpA family protein [Magnetococcales bacterium]